MDQTVVGLSAETNETIIAPVDAENWVEAFREALDRNPDLQFVAVLDGRVNAVGTAENLPGNFDRTGRGGAADHIDYSVIGFDLRDQQTKLCYFPTAVHWSVAAWHMIVDIGVPGFRFTAAFRGQVRVIGTFQVLYAGFGDDIPAVGTFDPCRTIGNS